MPSWYYKPNVGWISLEPKASEFRDYFRTNASPLLFSVQGDGLKHKLLLLSRCIQAGDFSKLAEFKETIVAIEVAAQNPDEQISFYLGRQFFAHNGYLDDYLISLTTSRLTSLKRQAINALSSRQQAFVLDKLRDSDRRIRTTAIGWLDEWGNAGGREKPKLRRGSDGFFENEAVILNFWLQPPP